MALDDYLNLFPSQHRQKPRCMATAEALLRPLERIADILEELRTAFDLDRAIGGQLDAVGVRVGRGRYLNTPMDGLYFALETEGVGIDEGIWKGDHDPETCRYTLPDDFYRLLLRAKVAANAWDGTIPGAYEVWEQAFAATGSQILIQDNQDMTMSVGIAGLPLNPVFEQLLLQGYIPLKAEGVGCRYYVLTLASGPLFALDCDTEALAGLDTGSWPGEIFPE